MKIHRIKPGSSVDLAKIDPSSTPGIKGGKEDAAPIIEKQTERLEVLQELLYAEHRRRFLIVLQGMDTSGKDGVIRHVFDGVDPQGVRVAQFKKPTSDELDRDFLWRAHTVVPRSGEMVIFNRSHYEDVLIVRVHTIVPEAVWSRRYDQINAFEKMLAETGTTILKFHLHISLEEQKERLQSRLDDPEKRWKFRLGDLTERDHWTDYRKAYEEVLEKTSTKWAPWYVVPSDRKWYRNLVIGNAVVETLESFDMKYPEPEEDLTGVVIK